MSLVMGMDQHRAQISAEWIDTITGEISRARVKLADRAGVRKFLARFKGEDLEVALEATTGWRFLVEELQRVGADVHLAEVVQTCGLKGRGEAPVDEKQAVFKVDVFPVQREHLAEAKPGVEEQPECVGVLLGLVRSCRDFERVSDIGPGAMLTALTAA